MSIAPIRTSVTTKAPPPRAFELFASHMGEWWPKGMTTGANPAADIVVEPRPGGRWFERDAQGVETRWGDVIAWDPPRRLLLAWRLNARFTYDPDLLTEVELTFRPLPEGGTQVDLEHRDLARLGVDAAGLAPRMQDGWTTIITAFAAMASSAQQGT